ncbi:MAG TPA: TetR/AcrR family transcriptional regulator [Candidatus Dormibacteraeota bacterium]
MGTRSRLRPDARRRQLVEVGVRLFSQVPYHELSLEEVAEQAGISRPLVYRYFPTKRAFYVEALRFAAEQLLDLVERASVGEPEQALRGGLSTYLGYVEEHAHAYRAILRGDLGGDPEVMTVVDGVRQAIYQRVLRFLQLEEPLPPLPRLAVLGWIGFVEAVSLEWAERRDVPLSTLAEALAGTLVQALGQWSTGDAAPRTLTLEPL